MYVQSRPYLQTLGSEFGVFSVWDNVYVWDKKRGQKSSSKVKRKASKSSWAPKQKAENAAFEKKAIETGRLRKCYRLRCQRFTFWRPGQQREQIFHRQPRGDPRSIIDSMGHGDPHDLDENMWYDKTGRIQCVSGDGQAFHQVEWASRDGFGLRLLSRTTIETTKRARR